VYYYPNFLSTHECEELIRLGEEFIKPTQVTAEGGVVNNEVRSSKAHFLSWEQEAGAVPQAIKRKVHAATKIPAENMEALQVQRYGAPRDLGGGQIQYDFYKPHVDSMFGHDRRIATMIFYLSDVVEGGDTVFPWTQAGKSGRPFLGVDDPQKAIEASVKSYNAVRGVTPLLSYSPLIHSSHTLLSYTPLMHSSHTLLSYSPLILSSHSCVGSCHSSVCLFVDCWCQACKATKAAAGVVKVRPKRGAAVLFYTLLATGELDPLSIHSSCPVGVGACVHD
jgi:hypothetical protein